MLGIIFIALLIAIIIIYDNLKKDIKNNKYVKILYYFLISFFGINIFFDIVSFIFLTMFYYDKIPLGYVTSLMSMITLVRDARDDTIYKIFLRKWYYNFYKKGLIYRWDNTSIFNTGAEDYRPRVRDSVFYTMDGVSMYARRFK